MKKTLKMDMETIFNNKFNSQYTPHPAKYKI